MNKSDLIMRASRFVRVRLFVFGYLVIFSCSLSQAAAAGRLPSQSQTQPADEVERLLQEGVQAYRARQLPQAVAKLKQAHQLVPENSQVHLILGLMLYEENPASPEAQRMMERAAVAYPHNLELQLKLLDSYLQLKNDAKGAALLDHLKGPLQSTPRFTFEVAYTLVRYGQYQRAESLLDECSAMLNPILNKLSEQELKSPARQSFRQEAGEILFIRGMIAASRENNVEAMRLFQAADRYEFPARDSLQMQMLAEALFRLGEYPLSIQAYEAYARSFPLDAEARMHLAIGYYTTAAFDKARENFERVLAQAPRTANLHLYLGLVLLEQKSHQEARQHFEEALKADRQSYQAMAELAYLDYLAGDNERCRAWLEKARPLNPTWTETNMVAGLLYNRLAQFDRAVEVLEQVVKEKPNHYKAHYQLSLAYQRLGDEARAKAHADIYDRLMAEEKSRQLGDKAPKH